MTNNSWNLTPFSNFSFDYCFGKLSQMKLIESEKNLSAGIKRWNDQLRFSYWNAVNNKSVLLLTLCFMPNQKTFSKLVFQPCNLVFVVQMISLLPEEWKPGETLFGCPWQAVVFTALIGVLTFTIFFWRTVLAVSDLNIFVPTSA